MINGIFSNLRFFYLNNKKVQENGLIWILIFPFFWGIAIFISILVASFILLTILVAFGYQIDPDSAQPNRIHFFIWLVLFFAFIRFVYKGIKKSNLDTINNASGWTNENLFEIRAVQQGLGKALYSKDELQRWLDSTEKSIHRLYDETRKSRAPNFIIEALSNMHSDFISVRDMFERNPRKSHEFLRSMIDSNILCIPDSQLGAFIYNTDTATVPDYKNLPDRLLCYVLFFSAKIGGEIQPLNQHLDSFFEKYEHLRITGTSKVLFDLSINSAAGISKLDEELKKAYLLQRELNQALVNARTKLKLVPASRRWQRSARLSSVLAFIGLVPFLLMLVGLPTLLWLNWRSISSVFVQFIYTQDQAEIAAIERWQNFFTNAPWATFVFVTVPALLFAWILKHFSRIFIQNMNLASDAGRRAALVDVYSRIVSDPDLNKDGSSITDEQKKIIFEAIFRPRDPRHTDDGIDHLSFEKVVQTVKGKSE